MSEYPNEQYLADIQWLNSHLNDENVRVLDVRFDVRVNASGALEEVAGREDYMAGHIPGAQFVDLHTDLANPLDPNSIIGPEAFSALMSNLGIGPQTTVVLYDDRGGVWAARLWWALRYYGHNKVKMLNGGLSYWRSAGFSVAEGTVDQSSADFSAEVHPELRVTKGEVLAAIDDKAIRIIDALPEPFYKGELGLYPGLSVGHVPGALNVPTENNLDSETLCIKTMAELKKLWKPAAIDPRQRVITYCGGGVFAAFALFILALMGHENTALYDASWKEWGADNTLPVETNTA